MNDICEYCSTTLGTQEKLVTVYRHRRGRHFIFESVPARVCIHCGERYFRAEIVRQMDEQMKLPSHTFNSVSVPVIPLASFA